MKKFLTTAIAVTVLASAGMASAQGAQHNNNGHQSQGPDRHDDRHATKRYKAPNRYQPPRGYQAGHQWRRGEKLPASYRGKGYVVDHRRYGLGAPPRGYQYVRVGNDVVLTAIATGVISSVIFQLFQ